EESLLPEQFAHRRSFDVLEDDVELVFTEDHIVDRRNVGMREPSEGLGFAAEPLPVLRTPFRPDRVKGLDRYVALEDMVASLPNLAESALTECRRLDHVPCVSHARHPCRASYLCHGRHTTRRAFSLPWSDRASIDEEETHRTGIVLHGRDLVQ